MSKIIGLTGGIGSGKTTVARCFSDHGIPVYIADEAGREVMRNQDVIDKIKDTFGESFFEKNVLNRGKLADTVFNNPEKLKELNNIVHPAVRVHFNEWLRKHSENQLVVYEAAILFESGNYQNVDYIITVTAPLETRIERVMTRDNIDREQVLKRINAQWTDQQRIEKSDFVIENLDSSLLEEKILEILKILSKK